jgi:sugar lactone lactonase YvrE/acetyl esterase/lipase
MKIVLTLIVAVACCTVSLAEETKKSRPTHADVKYGEHALQAIDFWKAEGEGPRPLLVYIHGGGWTGGDKKQPVSRIQPFLDKGISYAAVNYRLTGEVPLPAPVHDAARAIQFIRSKAAEWNIDKSRIALTGGSAGACTSMWILTHDELADPKSDDPVARESTRVTAAAVSGGQTSIDPKVIEPWLGPKVLEHRMINMAVGEKTMAAALKNYEKHRALHLEFSPYNHVSAGDPPLLMTYGGNMKLPSLSAGHGIHHPVYGVKMKEKADKAGQECHLLIPGHSKSDQYASANEFLIDKLIGGAGPGIIPKSAKLEALWEEGGFTEGAAAGPDGKIYFSDFAQPFASGPARVMCFDPASGKTTVHCADSKMANGLMFDAKGRLIACCASPLGGHRALVEILPDGKIKTIVDRYQGKRFNSPNDLVIDAKGRIYFSDPKYVGPEKMELPSMDVYRLDPDGTLHRATTDITKPNGVMLSHDGKTLYVAETDNGTAQAEIKNDAKRGRMTLNAFPVNDDGSLGTKKVLVDFGDKTGTDGMTVDRQGNIYAAVRSADRFGIVIYSPAGRELGYIKTPTLPTNCCFGIGNQSKTLYVTAGSGFYRIALAAEGHHSVPHGKK